ncbi:hypothetical protein [Leptospira koniambonensis]|uniref:hypothetical protein n=1 Tax=Leptospira koniambonensis TaxID=2484950 RepID=UPI003EBF016D
MNAEKINKLAKDISEENGKLKISNLFSNVIVSLSNIVNQPNQPNFQTDLTNNLNSLHKALNGSLVNMLSPAWSQMLVELNIDTLFGANLSNRINHIIRENGITPANALNELSKIHEQYNKIIAGFSNVASGLSSLGVGFDILEKDICEIGILIPRSYIHNNLESFGNEIREINFILNIFSELIEGEKKPFILRNLSTTDPFITVAAGFAIAAGVAKAIGFVIDNYKKLLEIKKLKNELKKQGLSDEDLKGIEAHSNKFMEDAIGTKVKELKEQYLSVELSGRSNELLSGLKISLNKIANRVDSGFNFEIRINLSENKAEESEDINHSINEIQLASKSLEFIKSEGEPILSLPEKN